MLERNAAQVQRSGGDERKGKGAAGGRGKWVDRWKFENSVQPGSSNGLGGIVDGLFHGTAAQQVSMT